MSEETTAVAEAPATEAAGPEANSNLGSADLAKYDIVLVLDRSGSMSTPDINGKTRWAAAQEATEALARKAAEYDQDGIDLIVFGGQVKTYNNITPDKVTQVFTENEPNGSTDTTGALLAAIELHRKNPSKPTIIAVITDSAPNDKDSLKRLIIDTANSLGSDDELGITFLQIGSDAGAQQFLKSLDDDLQGQGAKFDIVDTKTFEELENMTLTEALLAAVND